MKKVNAKTWFIVYVTGFFLALLAPVLGLMGFQWLAHYLFAYAIIVLFGCAIISSKGMVEDEND